MAYDCPAVHPKTGRHCRFYAGHGGKWHYGGMGLRWATAEPVPTPKEKSQPDEESDMDYRATFRLWNGEEEMGSAEITGDLIFVTGVLGDVVKGLNDEAVVLEFEDEEEDDVGTVDG